MMNLPAVVKLAMLTQLSPVTVKIDVDKKNRLMKGIVSVLANGKSRSNVPKKINVKSDKSIILAG
jgi:hypothetical protein